ncbi:hypothetical protein SCB49_07032 [unidentified eubacterium SCB49]|nr:hypothetical protein SCB49_07032 [unidentified eubacterium SCB49]
MKLATTIQEVITILDEIILVEKENKSTLAFFPVLYNNVTKRIRNGIINGEFEDNSRMEKLDVIFANRYIKAYYDYKAGLQVTESWYITFEASQDTSLLIIQHILMGINAHINLDLGIVTSETVGVGNDLESFKNDFNKINEILNTMVNGTQASVNSVSPFFRLLELVGKGKEDKLAAFSINVARDGAWLFAQQYHKAADRTAEILKRDGVIAMLALKLSRVKSKFLLFTIKVIRLFESKNVLKIVAALEKA